MFKAENQILNVIKLSQTSDWNIKQILSQVVLNSAFEKVSIGKCIKRIKNEVAVQDNVNYKRITIKTKGGGVSVRDELLGVNIKTKNQYRVSSGQLAVSKIDARNGAFGIIPPEADDAIITGNFWTFDVDTEKVYPQFLVLLLSSEIFVQAWLECSNGSGNRLYLQEEKFLKYKIPLPSIKEQQSLLKKYNENVQKADCLYRNSELICSSIQDELCQMLKISAVTPSNSNDILHIAQFKNLSSRWEWDCLSEAINRALENCKYPVKTLGASVTFVNRSWKKSTHPTKTFSYVEIGGINADDNSIVSSEVNIDEAPSRATQTIKAGDLIIGTTRPYLQRFAITTDKENDFVCSSGFQVIAPNSTYDLRYILSVLKIDTTIKQFESLMTGALYPAINIEQLKQVRIPFPPIEIQKEIANRNEQQKSKIKALRTDAESVRQQAKKEFEEAVFGI